MRLSVIPWTLLLWLVTGQSLPGLKPFSLILQGGRDSQVYQADYDRFKQALNGKDAEFYWLPNLNHLFMLSPGGPSFDYSKPSHVGSQVVDIIANW